MPDTTTQPQAPEVEPARLDPEAARARRRLRKLTGYAGPLVAIALIAGYLTVKTSFFWSTPNLLNILDSMSVLLIVSVGTTFVMLAGGFDLSVGSVATLAGIIFYVVAHRLGWGSYVALFVTLVFGGLVGLLFNGGLIAYAGLNFVVVTLGSYSIIAGIAQVYTRGNTPALFNDPVLHIVGGRLGNFPSGAIWAALIAAGGAFVLKLTPFGRAVYAVGGNQEAARLTGVDVKRLTMYVYGIGALLATVGGIVAAGQIGGASPTAGSGLELTASATVLIGGTNFGGRTSGGGGGVTGTLLGVVLLALVSNAIGLLGIPGYWQQVVSGGVLIAAVAFGRLQRSR